jgi:hypothetical protein
MCVCVCVCVCVWKEAAGHTCCWYRTINVYVWKQQGKRAAG